MCAERREKATLGYRLSAKRKRVEVVRCTVCTALLHPVTRVDLGDFRGMMMGDQPKASLSIGRRPRRAIPLLGRSCSSSCSSIGELHACGSW